MTHLTRCLKPLPDGLDGPERAFVTELRRVFYRTGRSLKQLEHATHFSDSNWSRYLSGRTPIPDDALRALADAAGLKRGEWLTLLGLRTAADEAVAVAAPPRRDFVPRELPPAPCCFAGRGPDVAWLDAELARPAEPGAVRLLGLTGPRGVGKTGLALHWGHRVARRFPDGQLYADLGAGVAAVPRVLRRFVRALGMPRDEVPPDEESLVAAYRSYAAGRRLLVVLDDVADAAAVPPLLPGCAACSVVLTSRALLPALTVSHGLRSRALAPLSAGDAATLLVRLTGDDRLAAEPAPADAVRSCGGLPLAVREAAAAYQEATRARLSGLR